MKLEDLKALAGNRTSQPPYEQDFPTNDPDMVFVEIALNYFDPLIRVAEAAKASFNRLYEATTCINPREGHCAVCDLDIALKALESGAE